MCRRGLVNRRSLRNSLSTIGQHPTCSHCSGQLVMEADTGHAHHGSTQLRRRTSPLAALEGSGSPTCAVSTARQPRRMGGQSSAEPD